MAPKLSFKSLPLPQPPVTLLVAPGGYGKSHWLNIWRPQLKGAVLEAGWISEFSDGYFDALRAACESAGLPVPEPAHPGRWARQLALAANRTPLWVIIDNWERLESLERVEAFWKEILQDPPDKISLLIASRKPPRLPFAPLLAQSGHYFDREQLNWSLTESQVHWQSKSLDWTEADQRFYESVQGWPLGLLIQARKRAGELSEETADSLLLQALQTWLPPFVQDAALLWQPELQARLKDWQVDNRHWMPLLSRSLDKAARPSPAYWLWLATSGELPPDRSRVLLERALSLCAPNQRALRLNVLTRLAHMASLQGDWALLDQYLEQGEDFIEEAASVDVAAWYYLRANRDRQACRYQKAHSRIDALLALPARHPAVMNFQVRARILRGLTAYQQGDYALTRSAYTDALYLAAADENTQIQLELKIMLAYLDALQGLDDAPDFEQVQLLVNEVENLPLNAQPLCWLNLAFLQILGEHLDLKQGQMILTRVRETSAQLAWRSLDPMIADVEARLWRFHQDYDRADRLHSLSISQLEPDSFEWLHASLNQALTLMRRRAMTEARAQLEMICERTAATGTLGLLREAQAALQALDPGRMVTGVLKPVQSVRVDEPSRGDTPLLEIRSFGSFQLRLDGQVIERWPRKRARHLLLQLLLHPHGLHRETLADWLTGSDDLESALRSLDVHMHALRKLLEPERRGKQASRYIRFHDAVYAFNWDCHYRWDVESFSSHYQIWLKNRENEPFVAEQAVSLALDLYTGPFLPELDFADEWLAERESYARRAGDMVHWSLDHLSRQGAHEQAEDRAELLLKWDSLSETGFSWLLRLAGQLRDRNRLERLGERMEQTFDKELGCPPPKELLQLYRAQMLMVK